MITPGSDRVKYKGGFKCKCSSSCYSLCYLCYVQLIYVLFFNEMH